MRKTSPNYDYIHFPLTSLETTIHSEGVQVKVNTYKHNTVQLVGSYAHLLQTFLRYDVVVRKRLQCTRPGDAYSMGSSSWGKYRPSDFNTKTMTVIGPLACLLQTGLVLPLLSVSSSSCGKNDLPISGFPTYSNFRLSNLGSIVIVYKCRAKFRK